MRRNQPAPPASDDGYDSFFAEVRGLASQMQSLHLQAVRETKPVVDRLLRSGSQDEQEIDRTLDHLLNHACVPEGLELFRSLCRHYYFINPVAASQYVHAYRELWDSGEEQLQNTREAELGDGN